MAQTAPSREVKLTFAQIAPPPGSMALRGVNPNGGIEFGMRSDEVASKAVLNLEYTPRRRSCRFSRSSRFISMMN